MVADPFYTSPSAAPRTRLPQPQSFSGLSGIVQPDQGGTGLDASPADGDVLIGDGSADGFVLTTLTAGANVTITNAPGSITIAASGGGGGTVTAVASADANLTVSSPTTTPTLTVVAAPKLATARTFTYTGDATGGPTSFDGSASVSTALTLGASGVSAGSYTNANITVDAKGRVTAAANGSGGSGTVTSVATGTGLTGGPITGTGTVSLAAVADGTLLSNVSGSSAAPAANSLSAVLDHDLSSTQNQIPIRGASSWGSMQRGPVVSQQSGTNYTFALGDAWNYTQFTSASAVTATVPPQSSVAWLANTVLYIEQNGAGAVTIAAGAGVTINHLSSTLNTSGRYGVVQLIRTASDTWTAFGAFS